MSAAAADAAEVPLAAAASATVPGPTAPGPTGPDATATASTAVPGSTNAPAAKGVTNGTDGLNALPPPAPGPASAASAGAPLPPAAPAAALQLPVVDLIGLRFSLQHLRLVGYGLLAVWGSEVVNLLTTPRLAEIGTRLHYTSQFLDLTPILLVAIGLIAYQGGLRRRPLELVLLPLLLALLPLLSAFHFFLAPVSVANVITLTQKQEQIGLDQLERIDAQIDRASTILRESASIDALLEGLQRIPGLQVRVPPKASVSEARQEVRRSLERERDRLRDRIETNLSASREAFLRRAATNAALALVGGLLLWGLHHGAMREMQQAIPFLDWMLMHGEQQQPEALQELLQFQRACAALGWFSLLERCLRLVRRVVRRPSSGESEAEPPQRQAVQPPANPFAAPPQPARRRGIQGTVRPPGSLRQPSFPAWQSDPLADGPAGAPGPGDRQAGLSHPAESQANAAAAGSDDPEPSDPITELMARSREATLRREERRRQRDLDRYFALRRRIEREGADPFAAFAPADPEADGPAGQASPSPVDPLSPRQLRRLQRDQRRARAALAHMAQSDGLIGLQPLPEHGLEQELAEELRLLQDAARPSPPPPRGLAGLWHWLLTRV